MWNYNSESHNYDNSNIALKQLINKSVESDSKLNI